MTQPALKFYNMMIHLIKNNKLYEENVAVKNVWKKEGNTFLDVYFYRTRKSYVFDAVFIHDILDLSNEKYYQTIEEFAADFAVSEGSKPSSAGEEPRHVADKKIFEPISVDLIILTFMACLGGLDSIQKSIICDYIRRQIPQARNMSRPYLETYIESLSPDDKSFYNALRRLNYQNKEAVEHLCAEAVKVCLADGRLHYREKFYIAELLQVCREAGINMEVAI